MLTYSTRLVFSKEYKPMSYINSKNWLALSL